MTPFVFRASQGREADAAGATMGAVYLTAAATADGALSPSMRYVSELAAFEVDVADAPGYSRPTFGTIYEDDDLDGRDRVQIDPTDVASATADTTGADSVGAVAFFWATGGADSTLELFSVLQVLDHPGVAEDDIVAPNGIGTVGPVELLSFVAPLVETDGVVAFTPGGTPNGSKFLRDDKTWAVPAGGGGVSLPIDAHDVTLGGGRLDDELAPLFGDVNALQETVAADAWLQPVRVVATSTISLVGEQTIDGVAVVVGDAVLVTNNATNNRIYVVAAGSWTNAAVGYVSGAAVRVAEGTLHAGSEWYISTPDPFVVGTDATTWTEFTGGGAALSDDDPADLGTADPGTSPDASRSDHIHDLPTAAAVGALATGALDTDATMAANSDTKVASQKATKTYVGTAVAALVASAPGTLDTLDELAAALADDASFASTMTTALAAKAPSVSPTFTGTPVAPTASVGTNATQVATTAYVDGAVHAATGKTTPVDADEIGLVDSAASNVVKKLTWANLKATLKTYFDGLYTTKATFPVTETIALGDETTAITTGTAKVTWRAPWAFTLTGVRASVNTASSSGIPTVNIKESGTTVLSTKLTIDASELTSVTAATPAVISDSSIADDAEITFDIDVAGTGAKGLKVTLYGTRSA